MNCLENVTEHLSIEHANITINGNFIGAPPTAAAVTAMTITPHCSSFHIFSRHSGVGSLDSCSGWCRTDAAHCCLYVDLLTPIIGVAEKITRNVRKRASKTMTTMIMMVETSEIDIYFSDSSSKKYSMSSMAEFLSLAKLVTVGMLVVVLMA